MIKNYLTALCLCCALSFCFTGAQAQGQINESWNNLLPRPKIVRLSPQNGAEDSFVLNSGTVIVCKNKFLASYLKDHLQNLNYNPQIVYKNRVPRKFAGNYIFIKENDKTLIPENENAVKEGYRLKVEKNGITLTGTDYGGMFNGIQTLLQLLPPNVYKDKGLNYYINLAEGATASDRFVQGPLTKCNIPSGEIIDWPLYNYRGMMLDVSRTFRPAEEIYQYLDWLAYNKINKFHWHLTDDQGWRIEIKSYPELMAKGAWRGPGEAYKSCFGSGNKRYGGYYTQEQIKGIVKYAAERNIEIIPEIDMPGHSGSVAVSYPDIICRQPEEGDIKKDTKNGEFSKEIWCVAKEDNYKMLDGILKEMSKMFPSKIMNIGGDEVNHTNWKNCPDCQALIQKEGLKDEFGLHNYFVKRLNGIAEKYGKVLAGWEEIINTGDLNPETTVYIWHSTHPAKDAVAGHYPTILQVGAFAYFDMKHTKLERGHNWAGLVPTDKTYSLDAAAIATPVNNGKSEEENTADFNKYVKGLQGGLWEELGNRPVNFVEYQTFPRLCALSEVAWGKTDASGNTSTWEDFKGRLTRAHYKRMSNMGIRYRVVYPNVMVHNVDNDTVITNYNDAIKQYKLVAEKPYDGAVIKYAIVAPETAADGVRGQADTTVYKYLYTEPIITENPDNYRFTTFASDTLHSIGVAQMSMPLHKYITPSFTVTSNKDLMEGSTFDNLTDYNPKTTLFLAGRGHSGDYVTITFDDPVECHAIDMVTGSDIINFYGITEGYAEYSSDGINYTGKATFDCQRAVLLPKDKVKSVRIVLTGDSDSYKVGIQDLKIF